MVTASEGHAAATIVKPLSDLPQFAGLPAASVSSPGNRGRSMLTTAFRPVGHIAAWLVWHSTGVSLLPDLDAPVVPRAE